MIRFRCTRALVVLTGLTGLLGHATAIAAEYHVSEIRQLEVPNLEDVHYVKPQWSPDGAAISFETVTGRKRRLYVSALGGVPREVVSATSRSATSGYSDDGWGGGGSDAVANFDLSWSNTLPGVYSYVGSGSQGYFGLFIGTLQSNAFNSIVGGGPENPYVAYPTYSPKADVLVYSQGMDPSQMEDPVLELKGWSARNDIRTKPMQLTGAHMSSVPQLQSAFSPKGDVLAFTGIVDGNNDIFALPTEVIVGRNKVEIAPGTERRLTTWETSEVLPSWSPDGKLLAFLSGRDERPRELGLWVMSWPEGVASARKLVGRVSAEDRPEWHPNGDYIFYVKTSEERQNPIEYVHVESGTTAVVGILDTDAALHTHLDISATGDRIAYTAYGRSANTNLTWLKLYTARLTLSR
jgi:hypothetical protein